MINIARLALLAAFSLSAASIACSAPPPAPSPTSGSGSTSTGSQDQKTARSEDGTTPPSGDKASAPSSNPDGGAPPAKGGGDGEKDVPPADPQCVASCNTGLKAKCQGDESFCEDICGFYTAQEIACLTAAPSCEKSVWIQCTEQNNGGGK